jgi:hypothetical protein
MVESRPPCRGDEIGKHSGLKALSALPETAGAEPFKFGETPECAIHTVQRGNAEPSPFSFLLMRDGRRGRCRD